MDSPSTAAPSSDVEVPKVSTPPDPDPDPRSTQSGEAASAKTHDNGNAPGKSYLRILSYGARNGGIVAIILGLICAMGSGVALPLMNIVFGRLVGGFNEYFMPGTNVSEQTFKATVNQDSLYIVYLFIGKFVLTYISMICFRFISLRASAILRLEYAQALFAQPVSRLDEMTVGSVTNAITGLSNTIQQSVSDRLAVLFQAVALLISAYAIAFRYSWALTLVVSASILFVIVGYSLTVPFLIKAQQSMDHADGQHASVAAEALGSIRTVLSLGAEAPLTNKYIEWTQEAQRRGLRMSAVAGVHIALLFFALYSSFALAFWYGLKLYRDGHISSINTVITVFFSVLIVVGILGNIASPLMIISKAVSASGAFFGMIDSERPTLGGLRDADVSCQSDITFDNVTFAYPTRPNSTVLNGLSARFQGGKTTALVGASGSGKSTVVALLERWYHLADNNGNISIGDRSIRDLDAKWWRSHIGLVQQEPFLFNDSIYNNVAFGLIGSDWEDQPDGVKMELVVQACKEAYADDFIQRLPLGYTTIVGESGITLSGGQRQRLAIARSIVKRPPILILDEATSSIDVRGEKLVQSALDRVATGRTTIMIAHRLSTVRRADHIMVMQQGIAIEEGSHDQLMARGGVYHGLVHAQRLEPLAEVWEEKMKGEPHSSKEDPQANHYLVADSDDPTNEEDGPSRSIGFFKSFGIIFKEQSHHWVLYVCILVGALGAGSGFALQSWLVAKLVQVFQFSGQKLAQAANFWSLMFFILALAMAVCYYVLGMASNSISMFVASTYRQDYFLNLLRKPVSYFDLQANSSGSLVSRLATDPKQLQDLFGPTGVFPLISVFNVIGCVTISFVFGWKLAAVTFFAAMPFLFLAAFMRIRYEIMFERMNAEVYADSSKLVMESMKGFRTVTSLTMEDTIIRKYSTLLQEQRQKAMRKAWVGTLIFAFSDSVELCAMALTFWYGGQLLASREYDTVAFFVVYIAIIQGGQSAGQFFSFGPNIAQAKASANRILRERDASDVIRRDPEAEKLPTNDRRFTADVEFQGVSFQYPARATPTFDGLDLTIPSGSFVAFVGASGCGKSTIISLLERFYDPTGGLILFGGRDIRSIELASYRRALSLVAQEPQLFGGTIRDNLLLGLEATDEVIPEAMEQACKDAEIHEFIMSLPSGYSTELGVNAQSALSGGQKQRLCIARALLRKPRLLLLDEATSSLDSHSEKVVQQAMERLAAKRDMTIIAVAHRLATIQNADVIFVFGEGSDGRGSQILEKGNHNDLLRTKGVYWQMCEAQALDQ
ncbi:ABC transporter ATP-binding protein [Aspergillus ibericus CBS 121593]|uniref:Putative ABC multidrug transporter n=1 Tax=Aspergillus ibericus CBS 121593 TaxID=1448316 RepID=A0A395H1Y5_9EURO|nr:putative ABC multidrug transporter [Aspergillus ibericus CBS 121593]RAL01225.1 putative ABC multidrug transporter [Aspergillus ibericus CBS 121593]